MSPEPPVADKHDKGLRSAESGKVLQNPQPPRNHEQATPDSSANEVANKHLPRDRSRQISPPVETTPTKR
jgi:hypothetical protein